MTTQEFSNEFDILYDNISSNQAPGLSEYEKSVFLTNAQDALVLELYSGKNALGDSFEKTEEVRQYLSNIVKVTTVNKSETTTANGNISKNSHIFNIPKDMWFPVYESVTFEESDLNCTPISNIEVVPVTHDEFSRINKNPFRKSNKNRVLRLNISGKIELVSDYTIKSYVIRYIPILEPIILANLEEDKLTIKDKSQENDCKLHPSLHKAILERAVQMAKISMGLYSVGKQEQ